MDLNNYLTVDGLGNAKLDSSSAGALAYAKYAMPYVGYPRHVTLVTRITGNATQKVMDLEIAMSPTATATGARVKTIVSTPATTGVQVEKWDNVTSMSDKINVDTSGTHIYQITMTLTAPATGSFAVYVDGGASPLLAQTGVTLRTTAVAGDNYISFGANSQTNKYIGTMDWLVWTTDGAYTPAQLKGKLPSGLGTTTGY